MTKTAVFAIGITLVWFVLGTINIVTNNIFWTGLLGFIAGVYFMRLENEEIERRTSKLKRNGCKK